MATRSTWVISTLIVCGLLVTACGDDDAGDGNLLDGGADADSDGDGDTDTDADLDTDSDSDVDTDADGDGGVDGEGDAGTDIEGLRWREMDAPADMLINVGGRDQGPVYFAGSKVTHGRSEEHDIYAQGVLSLDGDQWSLLCSMGDDSPLRSVWPFTSGSALVGMHGGDYGIGSIGICSESGELTHVEGDYGCVPVDDEGRTHSGGAIQQFWGTGGSDIVAVGWCDYVDSSSVSNWVTRGVLELFDGDAWSSHPDPPLSQLMDAWGPTGRDVFAVSIEGRIYRCDREQCELETEHEGTRFGAVWGAGEGNVYAVGMYQDGDEWGGVVLRRTSGEWNEVMRPADTWLEDVWGTGSDNVYVVGSAAGEALIMQFDGSEWNEVDHGCEAKSPIAIWGRSAEDIYVVARDKILHYSY